MLARTEIKMSIETIIVNYNAGETLQKCVQALLDGNEASSVTIVDNASSDHSAENLRDIYGDHSMQYNPT